MSKDGNMTCDVSSDFRWSVIVKGSVEIQDSGTIDTKSSSKRRQMDMRCKMSRNLSLARHTNYQVCATRAYCRIKLSDGHTLSWVQIQRHITYQRNRDKLHLLLLFFIQKGQQSPHSAKQIAPKRAKEIRKV